MIRKSMRQSMKPESEFDLGLSIESLLKEKDKEIQRLTALNSDIYAKLDNTIDKYLSANSNNSNEKLKEAYELKYQGIFEQKMEAMKEKYERLYLRTRKTLREKEKENLLMEQEMKENHKLIEKMKQENAEMSKTFSTLKSELETIKERETSKDAQIFSLNEEYKKLSLTKKTEFEEISLELSSLKQKYSETAIIKEKYEKEKNKFEEEKRDFEKVKELIMKRKDSLIAFEKVNREKEIENWKEELEKLKKAKNLSEINYHKEIADLKKEKKDLEAKLSKNNQIKAKEIPIRNSSISINNDLHATENDLALAYSFLQAENENQIEIYLNVLGSSKCDYLKVNEKNKVKFIDHTQEKGSITMNFHHVFFEERDLLMKIQGKLEENEFLKKNKKIVFIFHGPKRIFLFFG